MKIYELLFNTQIRKINPYWGCFHVIPPWRDYLMDFESKMLKRPSFYYWMHFYYQACAFGCWNGREDSMSARPGPLNLKTYFAQAGTRKKAWLQTPLLWASQSLNDEFGNWIVGVRMDLSLLASSCYDITYGPVLFSRKTVLTSQTCTESRFSFQLPSIIFRISPQAVIETAHLTTSNYYRLDWASIYGRLYRDSNGSQGLDKCL